MKVKSSTGKVLLIFTFFCMFLAIVSAVPSVVLNAPNNGQQFNDGAITFNTTVNSTEGLINISLWTNQTSIWQFVNLSSFSSSYDLLTGIVWVTAAGQTAVGGEKFTANINARLITVTKEASSGCETSFLYDSGNPISGVLLAQANFNGGVNATYDYPLSSGSTYYMVCDNNGSAYNLREDTGVTYPISKTNIDWIKSWFGSDRDQAQNIEAIYTTSSENQSVSISRYIDEGIVWNYLACNSTNGCSFAGSNYTLPRPQIELFGTCNATVVQPFLNITFKDETTLGVINASVTSSTFNYYQENDYAGKTTTFSESGLNYNYTFCGFPADKELTVSPTVNYKSTTTYPQRTWIPSAQTYNNTTTTQILYLLNVSDGTSVTFQVINPSNQGLSGVTVTAERLIDGVMTVVQSGTTDSAGSITLFVNNEITHTFNFSKSGFATISESIVPTQSSYTITMGGSSTAQVQDYTRGITLRVNPRTSNDLNNATVYNFNFTISTSFWDLESMALDLVNQDGESLGSNALSTTTGGTLGVNVNTSNNTLIIMTYNYTINGTTITQVAVWNIINDGLTGWSIKTFFEDFNLYVNSGMFGLDDFGVSLIVFLILFLSVGVVSFKFGVSSPLAVSSMVFAIIYFFDVTVDVIPNPTAVPNFFTLIAAVILIGSIIREVQR